MTVVFFIILFQKNKKTQKNRKKKKFYLRDHFFQCFFQKKKTVQNLDRLRVEKNRKKTVPPGFSVTDYALGFVGTLVFLPPAPPHPPYPQLGGFSVKKRKEQIFLEPPCQNGDFFKTILEKCSKMKKMKKNVFFVRN